MTLMVMGKQSIILYSKSLLNPCEFSYDRFLTGTEAVGIFGQSGLPQDTLAAIWILADDDKDGRLTSKEFCVAFHLILCIRYCIGFS